MRYHFCPKCGGALSIEKTQDKNKPQCTQCSFTFYQNPAVGVAAIVIKDQKLLLGKRQGSYAGQWCIPCGYVEWDEDVYDAVIREFYEETGLTISISKVYTVLSNFHNPAQHTVGIWFMAEVMDGEEKAGDDLEEVGYFTFEDMPELAFPTDRIVIEKLKSEELIQ
ncbi:ADP-ribose pyrophosphatase YjhB, NUDIX family [Geosporobacter subterraneus DSM 17957]|uniref:ADP-ribose pyrophosphatase YjhB, NUDIX family n=1 Tax=Geosporobacter subterraneus DSM 17957 TaxID=1121919 RepID=A0A1M6GEF6_9FIRM|nr:NUDIX hydrolase [Geosporobacter subterraneus]SHJ08336.1 ADP-ribose pyrophosphatase YjhB, NUDIX family [Geosporobacter subterraneus DSM 17957]